MTSTVTNISQSIPELTPFEKYVKRNELTHDVATKLKNVLGRCKIVLLADDSGSMESEIKEPNGKVTTRWQELKTLAAKLVELITVTNEDGLDIYFLNRGQMFGVKDLFKLADIFSAQPSGGTPLGQRIEQIRTDNNAILNRKELLILTITDGHPTDRGNFEDSKTYFEESLQIVTKGGRVHVSICECTDRPEDMDYLDELDGKITNFDNTDDYREVLQKIRQKYGPNFKFDYNDYMIKIVLATFYRDYYNLDQPTRVAYNYNNYASSNYTSKDQNGCCIIL